MPLIEIHTEIQADLQICFDLSRNIDFHKESLKHTDEIPISGKTTGLIELGESVTWEAKHLGLVRHLTSKITEFEAPNYFVDEMVSGAFKSFKHEHIFQPYEKNTLMINRLFFESPFGIIGKFANVLFLKKYMTDLLGTRSLAIKQKAEVLFKNRHSNGIIKL